MASIIYIFIQSIVFLYLSHHLPIKTFGTFSIAISLLLFCTNIIENGLPQSIIKTENPSKEDYNAVLYLNTKTAFYCTIVLLTIILIFYFSAIERDFIFPLLVLLPCLFLSAYNKVQIIGLQKQLKFKSIALIESISTLVYMISVLLALLLNLKIWILVIPFVIKYISVSCILNILGFNFSDSLTSIQSINKKKHWKFGKYIQAEKFISSLISYADVFIISSVLGVEVLGVYDILKRIVVRPVVLIYNGFEQLFYPLLVQSKSNTTKYLEHYSILNKLSKYIFINLTCIVFIFAPLIIKFLPLSYHIFLPTLRWLCVFASIVVIMNPIDIIMYSQGKSKLFFKWILSYSFPLLLVVYLSSTISLNAMIISQIILYTLLYIISFFALIKKSQISFVSYTSVLVYTSIVYSIISISIVLF